MTSALQRLVGDPEAFLDATFGSAPLHVPGRGDDFADVLDLDDVDEIVAATGLRAPAFRLVRDGSVVPDSRVTRRVRIGSRPVGDLVDVAAVQAAFADGASVVLQGLHRSWAPVAALCRSLEAELTHPVQANAYLTPPVAQGLDVHADPHDVFAVQTHGSKRWVVHPPGGGTPWDLELRTGDVLYLPAGTRHAAQTVDRPSLHLTIGVRTVDRDTVLRRALDEALRRMDHLPGAPLPAGWATDAGAQREAVTGWLETLADEIRTGAAGDAGIALDALAERFWSNRTPDRRGGLRDALEVDRIDDDTLLQLRPHLSLRLGSEVDGSLTLRLADRRLRLPGGLREPLEVLLTDQPSAPRVLADRMDEASRLVLCRRLVREGVLTIVRDRGDDGGGPTGSR